MKNFISLPAIITGVFFTCLILSSCSKDDADVTGPKEQLILRNWYINRIQLKVYSGSTFLKDTILAQDPKPKNFVEFTSAGSFGYSFNTNTSETGTYQFKGLDSVISTTASNEYRWRILLLTKQLFTAVSASNNDPLFPGYRVERYYTLIP